MATATETKLDPRVHGRPVPGFPRYRVTPDGVVWSCCRQAGGRPGAMPVWAALKVPAPQPRLKHPRIRLWHNSLLHQRARNFRIDVLVLELFVGPAPKGAGPVHRDGNPENCRADNLYWG